MNQGCQHPLGGSTSNLYLKTSLQTAHESIMESTASRQGTATVEEATHLPYGVWLRKNEARPLVRSVLCVPFSALTTRSGDTKHIQPIKNHIPLIPRSLLLEQVEEDGTRRNWLTRDHLEKMALNGRSSSSSVSRGCLFHFVVRRKLTDC